MLRSWSCRSLAQSLRPSEPPKRLFEGDAVEKVRGCAGLERLLHSGRWGRGEVEDEGTPLLAGRSVLRVLARRSCARGAPPALDRQVCRTRQAEAGTGAVLQG